MSGATQTSRRPGVRIADRSVELDLGQAHRRGQVCAPEIRLVKLSPSQVSTGEARSDATLESGSQAPVRPGAWHVSSSDALVFNDYDIAKASNNVCPNRH